MTTASRISPNQSLTDSKNIVQRLCANPFVKDATSPKDNHYTVVLSLKEEVVQVLINYLSNSGFLRVSRQPTLPGEAPIVQIHSPDDNTERIQQELNKAFQKVSQFLEYLELKQEYASGQVPRHLSQWLLEGGF
ncbi:MAG: hypothetical protein V4714_07960 [Bacteroidota bacterium]